MTIELKEFTNQGASAFDIKSYPNVDGLCVNHNGVFWMLLNIKDGIVIYLTDIPV